MARRTSTRRIASRVTTSVVATPWGRTVTFVAPGSADDHTLALFDMGRDDQGFPLDVTTSHDLFTEYDARTFPAPAVDMAPAVEVVAAVEPAPFVVHAVDDTFTPHRIGERSTLDAAQELATATLTRPGVVSVNVGDASGVVWRRDVDTTPAAPAVEITAVHLDVESDVTVHLFDAPAEIRAAIRAGDVATGDVVALVGERGTAAAVVVDGWPVAVSDRVSPWRPLDSGQAWADVERGRYVAAVTAALDVEV